MKIAFIGKMFSGKTTAAKYLTAEHGYVKLAFADPVKIVAAQMLNQLAAYLRVHDLSSISGTSDWTYDLIQERKTEPQVRKLLQLVGTELGRELIGYEDVWVDILLKEAANLTNVVVDDCRFPNEAEALRSHGFRIVKIERDNESRQRALVQAYPDTWRGIMAHPSETSLDNFVPDVVLYAENLEQLYHRVDQLVN